MTVPLLRVLSGPLLSVVGLLAAAAWVDGQAPPLPPPPSTPGLPPAGGPTPIEAAGRLIGDARASFARVKDYTGLLYKQERVGGQMSAEQTIQVRFRQQPFSVHMKWVAPKNLVGQEACYVAGQNNNMMRAKSAGAILGAIGFVSIDPNDARAKASSRHSITEAGLGNTIERMVRANETDKRLPAGHISATFGEYRFLNRNVTRVETTRRLNNGQVYCHRSIAYFDKETRLPVRIELYDWPKPGSPPGGELLEAYSYVDLKFNVGLNDAAFAY